jgi:uncharacterized protein GlcG (DUF336 family)
MSDSGWTHTAARNYALELTPECIEALAAGVTLVIIPNGVVDGACGVGGGSAQQDEDCARAGVAKL